MAYISIPLMVAHALLVCFITSYVGSAEENIQSKKLYTYSPTHIDSLRCGPAPLGQRLQYCWCWHDGCIANTRSKKLHTYIHWLTKALFCPFGATFVILLTRWLYWIFLSVHFETEGGKASHMSQNTDQRSADVHG